MRMLCLDRPRPGATFEKYQPYLKNEVLHTWETYKKGNIRDIYFRQDRPGVAVMTEFDTVEGVTP